MLKSLLAASLVLSPAAAFAADKGAAAAAPQPIPGPRTCFWYNGPFSADPYINIAYPDQAAFYWTAVYNVPAGAKLRLEGQFPRARYMSFVTYDELGRATDGVADFQIEPQPGSVNPFRVGAQRDGRQRSYRIEITGEPREGLNRQDGSNARPNRSSINSPQTADGYQTIIYRIYANDLRHPVTGGVSLPEPVLRLADGSELRGAALCDAMRTRRSSVGRPEVLNVSAEAYRQLRDQPGRSPAWPAAFRPEWHIQHTRADTLSIFSDNHRRDTPRGDGGFYPNADNRYVRTLISLRHGPVMILRGRAPTTPRTINGDRVMGAGQLRYWSICSNNLFVNSRVNACVFDEQIPVDADGFYTVMASKERDRPRNARIECGVAWLRLPDDGDGLGNADLSMLTIRHMLADPAFRQAAQNLKTDEQIPQMEQYLPRAQYAMVNLAETLYPCPVP